MIKELGKKSTSFMKVIQETKEAFSDFIHIMAIDRNIGHQKANNECKSTFRPLKAQGALIDEWIKEMNGIGFLEHHANIIGQAVVRRNPNTQYFNCYEFGSIQRNYQARRFGYQKSRYI